MTPHDEHTGVQSTARALGGLIIFGALVFGLTVGWYALFVWIGGAV